ncbi:MAG: ABC transporter substrate-binding protein [Desulfobacterales bacterium]|nr:ABC transporter substrate-binding protein [Desulfobacterales bacterium]
MFKKVVKSFVFNLLIALIVCSLSPAGNTIISTAAAADRDYIVVQTWGGSLDEAQRIAFFEPFTKETGIKVITVEAGDSVGAKLTAMQRSNNIEWDIITGDYASYVNNYFEKGLLEEIDYSIVDNTQDLIPGSAQKFGVGQYLEGVCLAYNTTKFPPGKEPKSWKDFFDTKNFPGPRAMHNWGGPADNLGIAMMSQGLQPDEIFPLDFDRAFKAMDTIKPHIRVWYTTGNQIMQALIDGEVDLAVSTDGRAKKAKEMGAPVKIEWNQGFFFIAYNAIVKGTPMKKEALELLKFCNRSEQQAIFTKHIGYSGTNTKSYAFLPENIQKDQSSHPDNLKKIFNFTTVKNNQWVLDNIDLIDEKWNTWIAK